MIPIIGWTIIFAIGAIVLVKGAEFLVDSGGKTAAYLGISTVIIGATLVSFGTSLPELGSSLNAALKGQEGISVGNVIGSNIANVLLVLGVSSLINPISVDREMIKREIPLMLGAMVLLGVFASTLYSNEYIIERWEGILLLIAFIGYISFFVWTAIKESPSKIVETKKEIFLEREEDFSWPLNLLKILVGILGIAFGSEMMIRAGIFYIEQLNLLESVVGLTIIAVATTLPELATSGVAAFKGDGELSLGNVVGSNTFNILMVIGICAAVTPLTFSGDIFFSFLIMIAVSIFLAFIIYMGKKITRVEGALMLAAYFVYVYYVIMM